MKSDDIHVSLEGKEVRDFLGKQYRRVSMLGLGGSVEWLEKRIAELQEQLKNRKEYLAVTSLINSQGWEAFDVSEYVPYNDAYFNFIGTEEEYEALVEKITKGER